MRILIAGASGVLGRATLPHLAGHDVVGLTRTPGRLSLLRELGAEAEVCDVYDAAALARIAERTQPQIVVNFLTDLTTSFAANSRIRREGAANVLAAATAVQASRLVVESVAFPLTGDSADALAELERSTGTFPGEALILRFGLFWGPDTFHESEPDPPAIHVDEAGVQAARLILEGAPGTHVVTETG